ncbi:DUF397 domain-containing protein [Streptomyces atratus]|uniref:DUF397 domain-containing protein n=1 Tax=Streptomyces atratus TaxID=1893 RepID=UPI00225AB659|nr:DUF397 domain-containing protein [Streptomyces atratus]MCX5341818.1 DUF397 domain-containing protein [Streptomyces atratus]
MADIPTDLTWVRAAPEGEEGPGPWIEIAFGLDELVHLRETGDPENVVTMTTAKWDAFTKGVVAGEFDHFAELDGEGPVTPS